MELIVTALPPHSSTSEVKFNINGTATELPWKTVSEVKFNINGTVTELPWKTVFEVKSIRWCCHRSTVAKTN